MPFWKRYFKYSSVTQDPSDSNPDPDPQHPSTGVGHTTSGGGSGGRGAAAAPATQAAAGVVSGGAEAAAATQAAAALGAGVQQSFEISGPNLDTAHQDRLVHAFTERISAQRKQLYGNSKPRHLLSLRERAEQFRATLPSLNPPPQERVNYGQPPTFQAFIAGKKLGGPPISYEEHQQQQQQQQQKEEGEGEEEGKKPSRPRRKGMG